MRARFFFICLFLCLWSLPPAFGAEGGPDDWGYVWSDDLDFEWADPPDPIYIFLGDDAWHSVPLEFSFRFYGISYEDAWIVSNGYLIFTEEHNTFVNQCPLPDVDPPNGAIYFYWDDLIPPSGGVISYKQTGAEPYRHFILTFENIAFFGSIDALSAQVILTETVGWIQANYLEAGEGGQDATIGIENATGNAGLSAACNEAGIEDETALFFGYPGAINVRTETDEVGLTLLWDDPSGAEWFRVESTPADENNWTTLGTTQSTSIADTNARECSSYRYRIFALAGELGRAATVQVAETFFPLAPADLSVVNIDGERNELFWRDRSGCEDAYVVDRKAAGGTFGILAALPADSEYFEDASPPTGDLVYRVKATSDILSSDYSAEAAVETRLVPVTDLAAAPYSDTKILLGWTDSCENEGGFAVERKSAESGDEDFAGVGNTGRDASSFLDFGLSPATAYAYRVRPFTLNTFGTYSNTATAETFEEGTPPADDDDDDGNDDLFPEDSAEEDDEGKSGGCGW